MRKMIRRLATTILFLLLFSSATAAEPILIVGSTTARPVVEKAIRIYHRLYPGVQLELDLLGSNDGISRFLSGQAHLAVLSRPLRKSELKKLRQMDGKQFELFFDALVPVVSREIPIESISLQQLQNIYSGHVTNWSVLGGPNKPILVASESHAHGSREIFYHFLFPKVNHPSIASPNLVEVDSMQQMANLVRASDQALGYLPLGSIGAQVRPLKLIVDDVPLSPDSEGLDGYPLFRPIIAVYRKESSPSIMRFLRFMTGKQVRKIIHSEGFITRD